MGVVCKDKPKSISNIVDCVSFPFVFINISGSLSKLENGEVSCRHIFDSFALNVWFVVSA